MRLDNLRARVAVLEKRAAPADAGINWDALARCTPTGWDEFLASLPDGPPPDDTTDGRDAPCPIEQRLALIERRITNRTTDPGD